MRVEVSSSACPLCLSVCALVYNTGTLMRHALGKLREVCDSWRQNPSSLSALWPTAYKPHAHRVSLCAIKNTRRKMEDRHLIVHDLNALYRLQVHYDPLITAICSLRLMLLSSLRLLLLCSLRLL